MDAFAGEVQFLHHMAPVWRFLPPPHRGRLFVAAPLAEAARALGLEAEPIDAVAVRRSSLPPTARPGGGPIAFVTSIGDTKIARRLGYRRFAFMEHGAGQAYIGQRGPVSRHPSYAGGGDREDVELFLVPNEYSAALWRAAYPAARVEIVGCPKLAELPRRNVSDYPTSPTVAISFHWPAFVCPESDTALGHYLGVLPDLAKAFTVIGHAHPKGDWQHRVERYLRRAAIPFVRDFDEVCRRADVYVCDNSSTIFEFAATSRPVVVLNSPRYRRNVYHGGRFWDWAGVGIQVDRADELVAAVGRALADPPAVRAERERILELVYPVRAGAAERTAAAIAAWLTDRATVAA